MVTFTDVLSAFNLAELLRVMWMEVAIASVAATVYFTLTGWIAIPGKKVVEAEPRKSTKSPKQASQQEPTTHQLVTKALRQGKIGDAVILLQELSEISSGYVPANLAPRVLMAAAKAPNFEDAMSELSVLSGKFESRSLEAVVLEAMRNKDVAACRQLQVIADQMSIEKSQQTFEALAKAYASDASSLRLLVEEAASPLALPFAKAVLEACAALKDVDLAAEVFEKADDADAATLRDVVEKAATAPPAAASETNPVSNKEGVTHSKDIRACAKSGDLKGAIKIFEKQRKNVGNALLYNSIMDACVECGDLEKAIDYFNDARKSGLADVISYNTAMKGYLSQGQVQAAEGLFAEISEKGMTATLASFHGLLNYYANAGNRAGAWKVVEDMGVVGIAPTAVTCSILLKGKLDSATDMRRVLDLVDTIEPMDEVLFHIIADSCIRTNQLHLLSKYHAKLTSQGGSCALTAPTYGSMIKAFGQVHDMKRVRDLWADMMKQGVQPTAITLGCMVEALVANRCTAEAWTLVQQMRRDESTKSLVNTVIYSTILKGFANAKETHKVMALYEEMKAEGAHPNNITYNTILNAFAQGGAMDRVPALLDDMKSADPPAEPDIVTYSTLVKGFCNSGALDRALEILKDVQTDGKFAPDEVMFNSLLDGCAKEHRPADAMKLLDDMKAAGVKPSNYTLSMLVKLMGRCRRLNQAFTIVEEISASYGLKVNIQVYTCLIQACFNNRQASKAVSLYDKIIGEGLLPDEMTYSALVKGCLHAGLVDKALHLTRCAYGLAHPKCKTPPGINARCMEDLVNALGDAQGKSLLAEVGNCQGSHGGRQGKGSSKGSNVANNAPWRQQR